MLDDLELHLGSAEEPPSFAAAEQEACWRVAMLEEMAAVEENRTPAGGSVDRLPANWAQVGVQGEAERAR